MSWRVRSATPRELGIRRVAISMVLVIIILLILVAAAAGSYFFFASSGGANSTHSSSTSQSSFSTGAVTTYHGTYVFTFPEGPSGTGEVNGHFASWNSTENAAGSFTFSVYSYSYNGTGAGHGNITVTTHGYCTGSNVVPYMFTIIAYQLPGENLTLAFGLPTPANVSVALTCQGSTQGFDSVDNPVAYLSVYPNLVQTASVPATISQVLPGGISYTITIEKSS